MKESNQETKLNMEDTNRLSISSHLNIAFQVQAATSHLTNEWMISSISLEQSKERVEDTYIPYQPICNEPGDDPSKDAT